MPNSGEIEEFMPDIARVWDEKLNTGDTLCEGSTTGPRELPPRHAFVSLIGMSGPHRTSSILSDRRYVAVKLIGLAASIANITYEMLAPNRPSTPRSS